MSCAHYTPEFRQRAHAVQRAGGTYLRRTFSPSHAPIDEDACVLAAVDRGPVLKESNLPRRAVELVCRRMRIDPRVMGVRAHRGDRSRPKWRVFQHLFDRGWTSSAIARATGHHHTTVLAALRTMRAKSDT